MKNLCRVSAPPSAERSPIHPPAKAVEGAFSDDYVKPMWNLDEVSPNEPLTDEMIVMATGSLGVRLPHAYIAALRQKNGGSTIGQYALLPSQSIPEHLVRFVDYGHVSIYGINGIGSSDQSILQTPDMTKEWGLPKGFIFLDGDGHTWIALDYRTNNDDPSVVFLESDSGSTLFIAPNFETFFQSLIPQEQLFDDDGEFIVGSSPKTTK